MYHFYLAIAASNIFKIAFIDKISCSYFESVKISTSSKNVVFVINNALHTTLH
jgi:hypothetical protein